MKIILTLFFILVLGLTIYGFMVFLNMFAEVKEMTTENQELLTLIKDYDSILVVTLESLRKCNADKQKLIELIFPETINPIPTK